LHIPDGVLSLEALGATAALSLTGISTALRRLRVGLPRRTVPLMGLAAAFLFAAQMLNFPVAGGTSGHLLGAVLAGVLLGPSAAVVAMTAVLVVQCLLFADGGVLALGANVFNLALVAVLGGYAVYRILLRLLPGRRGFLIAVAFGSWCSTILASLSCAAELAWSGVVSWGLAFPAMASVHMLIGLGEAVITTLVIAAVLRTRPDLVPLGRAPASPPRSGLVAAYGLALTIGLLLFGLPLASSRPDGFERVAVALGFLTRPSEPSLLSPPMADYQVPGIGSAAVATCAAGVVGTVIVFTLACGLAAALSPRSRTEKPAAGAGV